MNFHRSKRFKRRPSGSVLNLLSLRFSKDLEKEMNLQSSKIQKRHRDKFLKALSQPNDWEKRQQNEKLTPKLTDAN